VAPLLGTNEKRDAHADFDLIAKNVPGFLPSALTGSTGIAF
jgi:hypothetical protein